MNMLVRPAPMPEELDRGYLGRVMRMNGLESTRQTIDIVARMFGVEHWPRGERFCLAMLSMVAGQSLEQFVQRHSTIPLRRAITFTDPNTPHACPTRWSTLFLQGMVHARPGAYFCPECALADESFHGISYWRRDHQIPGQLWCPKHLGPLHYVDDEDAFFQSPATFLDHAKIASRICVEEAIGNEFVCKYFDIASGLGERTQPLHVKFVSSALRKRADFLGLHRVAAAPTKPLLSDLVRDSFPRKWLATVFPVLVGKTTGHLLYSLDRALFMANCTSMVWSYLLVTSVLYDSADDALNDLFNSADGSAYSPKRRGAPISRKQVTPGLDLQSCKPRVPQRRSIAANNGISGADA